MDIKSTRRWSDIHNLAVVTLNDGKKVGTVEDFYFDPQTSMIPALLVKTGMFGRRALMSSAVNAFGGDAVTTANESMLVSEKNNTQLQTLPLGQDLLSYRVMSESGTVIGTIGNILLDVNVPNTARIAAFEMSGGLRERLSNHYPTFEANSVRRYGQDVIVISDAVALELSQ